MAKIILISAIVCIISVPNTGGTKCVNKTSDSISDYTQSAIITSLLNNAKILLEDAKSYAILKTSCSMPIDCAAIQEANPSMPSGIHRIWPRSRAIDGSIEVYCDMDDDGGGWTVIQRRGDFDSGEEYFMQKWDAYKNGFGDLEKDFWLGNDKIFALTSQRLNIVKFVLRDFEKNSTYATYDDFWIEDENRHYTMHVNGYRGTAGDSFSYHNGIQFTTIDRDNDISSSNCATTYKGAWWFKNCHYAHLNGRYLKGAHKAGSYQGVHWRSFKDEHYSLKDSVIKIRPKDYKKRVLDVTPK